MENAQGERDQSYQHCEIREPLKRVTRGTGLGDRNWGRKGRREVKRTGNSKSWR